MFCPSLRSTDCGCPSGNFKFAIYRLLMPIWRFVCLSLPTIINSPLCQLKGENRWFLVDHEPSSFDFCTPTLKVQECEDLLLQNVFLLEIEFFGKIDIIAWLLMTIAKD
jgi:hypothetical protein